VKHTSLMPAHHENLEETDLSAAFWPVGGGDELNIGGRQTDVLRL